MNCEVIINPKQLLYQMKESPLIFTGYKDYNVHSMFCVHYLLHIEHDH